MNSDTPAPTLSLIRTPITKPGQAALTAALSLIRTRIANPRRAASTAKSAKRKSAKRTPTTNPARALIASTLLLCTGITQAELSANVGWVSDYYYRGLLQHSSSASAGIDYSEGGFYAGAWGADVGDGMEIDGYFGWGGEYEGFTFGAGFTGYYYTGDFDDTYQEINLSLGYGFASAEFATGEYENFAGPSQDYTYYAFTLEKDGLYGKYAGFSRDFDGDYLEFGYGFSVESLDLSIALIVADDPVTSDTEEALVFGIGKSFQIN